MSSVLKKYPHPSSFALEPKSVSFVSWVLVLSLSVLAGCGKAPTQGSAPPPAVTVTQPVVKTVTEWDEYTGRTAPVESVEIRARVSGYLKSVHFTDGGEVKKGDLLFLIDPRPFEAELERAQADLERSKTQLELAENDLNRASRLVVSRAISEEEYDTRSKAVKQAKAALAAAQAAVTSARLNVEYSHIYAPISGRISRRYIDPGNLVNGNVGQATLLTTIVSLDPIYVYVDVDEQAVLRYVQLRREGKRISARETRIPAELALAIDTGFPHKGYIDFVDNRIDPNTGTLRARGIFPNPDRLLGIGLFARMRVPASPPYEAPQVNDRAIGTDQSQKFLLVVNDKNEVEYRPVTLGPVIGGLRVIRDGVKPGEWVVIDGLQRARPGAKVTPQRSEMPGAGGPPPASSPLGERTAPPGKTGTSS